MVTGALALLGVVAAMGAAGAGGSVTGVHVAQSSARALYNVPPMLGKHVVHLGLGRLKDVTQVNSTNWSGYVDSADTFKAVAGSWTEPTVDCSSSGGGGGLLGLTGSGGTYSSFWVGLDGYNSNSVEQTGTAADCLGTGQPSYYAWYEMYPAGEQSLSTSQYPVSPGDHLTGIVTSSSANAFTLILTDGTMPNPKWQFSIDLSGSNLARSSAEWVAEAPSSCALVFCNGLPLANFGTVSFTGSTALDTASKWATISGFTDAEVTMQSNGTVKAQPGPLNNSGNGFSVTFDHS